MRPDADDIIAATSVRTWRPALLGLLRPGPPIHYVQQQCGHHSPAFTLSEYGHLFPKDQHSNVDVLDDVKPAVPARPDAHRRNHLKKRRAA